VLYRRWQDYDPSLPLRPWLFGIAFRVASAHRKRAAREVPHAWIEVADAGPYPDQAAVTKQARARVLDALEEVPLPRRAVLVMHDLDGAHAGYGAFWGEVQSNVHQALGALGVVTDGSIRDIPMIAKGFQMLAAMIVPSHAYVHVVDFGIDVEVAGMAVKSGDLVHADRHGAVVVPIDRIDAMQAAAVSLAATEARIIAAARSGAGVEAIKAAIKG